MGNTHRAILVRTHRRSISCCCVHFLCLISNVFCGFLLLVSADGITPIRRRPELRQIGGRKPVLLLLAGQVRQARHPGVQVSFVVFASTGKEGPGTWIAFVSQQGGRVYARKNVVRSTRCVCGLIMDARTRHFGKSQWSNA